MLRHIVRQASTAQQLLLTRRPSARLVQRGLHQQQPIRAISTPLRQHGQQSATPLGLPAPQPLDLWQLYLRSLKQRPLLTKSLTSFCMTCLSDSIAQLLGGAAGYSVWRCVRLGLYSASVGALSGHYWHKWLDSTCCPAAPKSLRAVGSKLALDQLVFTPVMTCAFFAFLKAAEGQPHLILPFIQQKLPSTLLAGYTVWPAVNVITFKFIPQDLRILFCSAVGLFWGTYMSLSCVNAAHPCTETGAQVSAVAEGVQTVQMLE